MCHDIAIGVLGKNSAWILKYSMQSLRSALQTLRSMGVNAEIIYVDGGSTDNSKEIIKDALDSAVRIIDAPGTNIPEARNIVVKETSSECIMYWDSDIIAPPYIPITLIKANRPIVSTIRIDIYVNSSEEIQKILNDVMNTKPKELIMKEVPFTVFGVNLIRREVFEKVGLFDDRLTQAEDRDFGLRAMCHGYKSYLIESEVVYDINRRLKSEVPITTSLRQYVRGIHKKAAIYAYTGSKRQKYLGGAFITLHALTITSLLLAPPLSVIELAPLLYQVLRYGPRKGAEMWVKSIVFYTMLGLVYPVVKFSNICNILNSW
ncbi:glycosyltransferase [Vulcanisaeta sp. JCM 16159]|uniref:glycosyltransferase n=1 Tax=Vulcanisaeta sp. JCM 16159 TaxID=1295371 RepID=UPI0006CFFCFE|nr:glycosyltransferase [Vulcanisaeta sp. JCM 16159]